MKHRVVFLVMLLTCLIAACSQRTPSSVTGEPTVNAKHTEDNYRKPGAPISMVSTYQGHTDIGVEDSFAIVFTAQSAGNLTVTIRSRDNLLVGGDIEKAKAVVAGETFSIPVSILASEDGKYYLKIVASLSNNQRSSRAFGIAIYAGDWKSRLPTNNQKQQVIDGVIILPVEETIITQ